MNWRMVSRLICIGLGAVASMLAVGGHAVAQSSGGAAASSWGPGSEVRIATEGSYKPWNFRNDAGEIVGFEMDLVQLLCADLKFQCRVQQETWGVMLDSLNDGQFDVIFAGMSITKSRMARAAFSTPYAATPAVFVSRKGDKSFPSDLDHISLASLDDFESNAIRDMRKTFLNESIGVQRGTTHEYFLRYFLEGYAVLRTYDSQGALDADLAEGKLTAMLASLGYVAPLVNSAEGSSLSVIGPRFSGGPFGQGVAAAVRPADRALADAFSRAIKRRLADGTIRELAMQWFGFDVSSKP